MLNNGWQLRMFYRIDKFLFHNINPLPQFPDTNTNIHHLHRIFYYNVKTQ